MFKFYKIMFGVLLAALLATVGLSWVFSQLFFLQVELLPKESSLIPWQAKVESDAEDGGSQIAINSVDDGLDYSFTLTDKIAFPFATFLFDFASVTPTAPLVDLSPYTKLTFHIACDPENVLLFVLHTLDDRLPSTSVTGAYRIPSHYFSCAKKWRTVTIDLNHLELPEWWLKLNKISLSDQHYSLDKVAQIAIAVTLQSPINTPSNVKVRGMMLSGYDYRMPGIFLVSVVAIWLAALLFLVEWYRRASITEYGSQSIADRPIISYQKLSLAPKRAREIELLLHCLAKEYSNPELTLDSIAHTVGINRTKINDRLNEAFGLSFSAYVNKLKLTEAARLLTENPTASISEVSDKVGYNNVSYFITLFKKEYGCTPKSFKALK